MNPACSRLMASLLGSLLLISGLGPIAAQAEGPQEEVVRQELDRAIQDFRTSGASAALSLLEGFGSVLIEIPASEKLDKEGKLALDASVRAQCTDFLERRVLPEHPLLKRSREAFEKAFDRARKRCEGAFAKAERAFESTDLSLLRAVREERAQVLQVLPELEAEVVANFRSRVMVAPSGRDDPVRKELDTSIQEFRQEVEAASQKLLEAFETVIASIPAMEKLGREQKLALDEALRVQRDAFLETGVVPDHPQMKAARDPFERAITRASKACEAAFLKAEDAYAKSSILLLRGVRAERIELLGRPPNELRTGGDLGTWKDRNAEVFQGQWSIEGEELLLIPRSEPNQQEHLAFGDPSWSHYDFEVSLKPEGVIEAVFITAHVTAYKTYCAFAAAGYENRYQDVVYWNDKWEEKGRDGNNGQLTPGWHRLRMQVRGELVRCFLDGVQLFETSRADFTSGRVGLGSWETTVRFKDIQVTDVDGNLLWSGLPKLPR